MRNAEVGKLKAVGETEARSRYLELEVLERSK